MMTGPVELEVRVAVFGGLSVWRGSFEVDVGSTRQRTVLALLLAAAGGAVSMSDFVDAVWPADPPVSAVNQVHRLVGQVRRLFEPTLSPHATGRVVLAAATGYRLAVDLIDLDLLQARDLARRADESANAGDGDKSLRLYVEAVERCRGPVFAGFDSRILTRPEIAALVRGRESLVVAAANAAVRFSVFPPQVLAAVRRVAEEAPLNETLSVALIRLLAAMGRRAEALVAYDTVRRALADELGVDPGRHLTAAFHELLADDHSDPVDPAAAAAEASTPLRPAQIPRPPAGFVDRTDHHTHPPPFADRVSGPVVITAIGGMAGIGKTALAVHWAHQLADQFPDGQLYLNLRGFDPNGAVVEPTDALARLLESLGEPASSQGHADVDTRAARYRSAMSGRRMVVLLDNARDSAQVRPLLPAASGSLVLVTSRNRLTSLAALDGASFIELDRLSAGDARTLLTNRIGPTRTAAEPAAVDRIVLACGGLPLALAIAAGRIATDPTRSLADFADELHEPRSRLDALVTGEPDDDIRSVLSWSVRALSVDAARLLRHMAAHPGPHMSAASLASVMGLTVVRVEQLARELVYGSLLTDVGHTDTGGRRYVLHDLVRAYAAELLDAAGERPAAERRLVHHYVLATRAAYLQFGRDVLAPLPYLDGLLVAEEPSGFRGARAWYAAERGVVRSVVDIAMSHGMFLAAATIVLDRRPMGYRSDALSDSIEQCVRVIDEIDASVPPLLVAELHRDVAWRYLDAPAGDPHRSAALTLYEQLGDLAGQANLYRNLCSVNGMRQRYEEAYRDAEHSVSFAERAGQPDVLALALVALADLAMTTGRFRQAVQVGERTLTLLERAQLPYLLPLVTGNVAKSWLELGNPKQALEYTDQAVDLMKQYSAPRDEYVVLACRAQAALELGERALAETAVRQFRSLVHGDGWKNLLATGVMRQELEQESRRVERVRHILAQREAAP